MNKQTTKKVNPLVNEIFPQQDLKNKYKVKKIIGKGQYGYVAKAVQRKTNNYVAIKKLINVFHNEFQTKRILREIVLLKNCKHPCIVSLIEILIPHHENLQNFNTIYIVTEYCDTDLRKLFKMEETFMQISDVKYILYQIACGIKYLHSASIIHRDLTPNNILLNGNGMKVKICDLGLARIVEKKQPQQSGQISSDEEKIESELSNLSIQEKESGNETFLKSFEYIQTESLPSVSTPDPRQHQSTFENAQQEFAMKRRHSNENIKVKEEKQQSQNLLSLSGNLDDLRGSQKNAYEQKQSDKKKKKLKRMNSKRVQQKQLYPHEKVQQSIQQISKIDQTKSEKREKKKKISNNPLAKLTLRVTTRWYRAPQIILLEKGYHKPIDIWSLGCLFGQLLKMIKSVCYSPLQRFPLFPGKYCYPVSPKTLCNINNENQKQKNEEDFKHDQLFMILATIGKPSKEDMEFLTDQAAKDYIQQMQEFKRKDFKTFFPSIPMQAVEILENTLMFNPQSRYTIDTIINHPFLESVRDKQFEKEASPIIMEFEEDENLTIELLKQYLASQIKTYL